MVAKANEEQIVNIYDCARKIVQQRTDRKETISLAQRFLEQIFQNAKDDAALEAIEERCITEKNQLPKVTLSTPDKLQLLTHVISNNESNQINKILKKMVNPQVVSCTKNGGLISFGALSAASLGLASVKCAFDDGTVLNGSTFTAAGGMGIGVTYSDINETKPGREKFHTMGNETAAADNSNYAIGIGPSSSAEIDPNRGENFAFGLGAATTTGAEYRFLTRPRKVDEKAVLKLLELR